MFKSLDIWLPAYLQRPAHKKTDSATHIVFTVCDHFEPFHAASKDQAHRRLDEWAEKFPQLGVYRDADGCQPKHTFFYPIEQYDASILNRISSICRETGSEVEIHLHHDGDTAETLRAALEQGKRDFEAHGLLSRDASGATRFAFIHGNWALENSHPTGRHCGVQNELRVLKEAGCYADLTLPSSPSPTQTRMINSLYYATSTGKPKAHDSGRLARVGEKPSGDLLLVQGPLGLNWARRKFGLLPRIDNADLTAANPPTLLRMKLWLDLQIHVQGRPEWVFIKLHTHGAPSPNRGMLLGEPMRKFHADLARFTAESGGQYVLHYATAREMVNIIHAAEDGVAGTPGAFRDYRYRSNLADDTKLPGAA